MKIKKIFIWLFFYFLLISNTYSVNIKNQNNTGTNNDNIILENVNNANSWIENNTQDNKSFTDSWIKSDLDSLNKKKNELINWLTWNDYLSKKIKELEYSIEKINTEKEILKKNNSDYEKKIKELEDKLLKDNKNTSAIKSELNSYKKAVLRNEEELALLKAEKINNAIMLDSLAKIKVDLKEKENDVLYWKLIKISFAYIVLLFVFIITEILYKKEKKESEYLNNSSKKIARLNIINVITIILFIILTIISILYLNPELAIWFLFFWSALILIFKDTILSFFASIIIITNYDIWSYIWFEEWWIKTHGVLVKLNPLYMVLKEFNENKTWYSWRIIKIPNKNVFEKSIIKWSENYSEYNLDNIILPIITKWIFEKNETKNIWKNNYWKISKIDDFLDNFIEKKSLKKLWIFFDYHNIKYKKKIFSDKEWNLFIEYSWIDIKDTNELIKKNIIDIYYFNSKVKSKKE